MLRVLDSGFKHACDHCVVFVGKTLYSHSTSLHPGVLMGTSESSGQPEKMLGCLFRWTSISIQSDRSMVRSLLVTLLPTNVRLLPTKSLSLQTEVTLPHVQKSHYRSIIHGSLTSPRGFMQQKPELSTGARKLPTHFSYT